MMRTVGLMIAVALLLAACGGGNSSNGSSAPPPVQTAPGSLSLQYGFGTGEVGMPFGPYPPTVIGTVTAYSVNPPLPAGLTLDPTSGVISGTPFAGSTGAYTVTASNQTDSTTLTFSLVILVPPTVIYESPVIGAAGSAFQLVPTLSGDVDVLTILPPLPDGLQFDNKTGVVSGTPSRARIPVTYTVTASNAGGAYANADLSLSVDPPPTGTAVTGVFRGDTVIGLGYVSGAHAGLTDNNGSFTYETGLGVTFSVGAVSIGTVPVAKPLVSPLDLVAQGTVASTHVLNVARFLMMLDQDGNLNNGIQISAAVTAAANSWATVDFDTMDLPTAVGPLIQQANTADGVTHVLPDEATARAHLLAAFYCTRSGGYSGTYTANATPGTHTAFDAYLSIDGSMRSRANTTAVLTGFDVQTKDSGSSLLDATFAQHAADPSVQIQGAFADASYLSGTYAADTSGRFEAVGETTVGSTYKFAGSLASDPSVSVILYMDDSNQISGTGGGYISGTVSGDALTGTIKFRVPYTHHFDVYPVSGNYSNSASGVTLDGGYTQNGVVRTFSTVGCRAN